MAHRKIQDDHGRQWDVWDTRPTIIDRRGGRERRRAPRAAGERRQRGEPRVRVEPQFRDGWLAFQSGTEWRRLGPIPVGWELFTDERLRALLDEAAGSAQTVAH